MAFKSACDIVVFGHHIPDDGMLAAWEDVKYTVLAGAYGAAKAVGLLETDNMFLVVDRARPVFNHSLFPCERCQVYQKALLILKTTDFAVGTPILD